jgi:hypothetical protein
MGAKFALGRSASGIERVFLSQSFGDAILVGTKR